MSIIYDALKKAQKKIIISSVVKASSKKSTPTWFYMGFVIVGLFGCGIALFLILYTPMAKLSPTGKQFTSAHNVASRTIAPSTKAVRDSSTGLSRFAFQLRGISLVNNEYIALVNDRILKVGDFLEGAQVVKITSNFVNLKFADQDFMLRLR